MTHEDIREVIRVARGNPTAEELGAIIAVLELAEHEAEAERKRGTVPPRSSWTRNSSMLRSTLVAGPRQWSASFRPGLN